MRQALISGKQRDMVDIWDLGAWVGGLPRVIETLNRCQSLIAFFEIQAPLPPGLVSSADHLKTQAAGFAAHLDKPFDEADLLAAIGAAIGPRP